MPSLHLSTMQKRNSLFWGIALSYHIIPYSKGGKTIANNGQLAHRACNASKNAKLLDLTVTA